MKISTASTCALAALAALVSASCTQYEYTIDFERIRDTRHPNLFDPAGNKYKDDYFNIMETAIYAVAAYPKFENLIEFPDEDDRHVEVYKIDKADGKGFWINVNNMKDLIIDGQGATVSLDSFNSFLCIADSQNITVRNFNITYDRMAFTQGLIKKIDREEGYFILCIDAGYPSLPSDKWAKDLYGDHAWQWGHVLGAKTKGMKGSLPNDIFIKSVFPGEGNQDYIVYIQDGTLLRDMEVGDGFVMPVPIEDNPKLITQNAEEIKHLGIHTEDGGLNPPAIISNISILRSSNVRIENITMSRSRSINFFIMSNEGPVVIENCAITYAQPTDMVSTWREGVMAISNRVGPVIRNCKFEGIFDEGIILASIPVMVDRQVDDFNYTVTGSQIKKDSRIGIFYPDTGKWVDNVSVKGVSPRAIKTDKEIPNLVLGKMTSFSDKTSTQIYNMDYVNGGFLIEGCTFGPQRGTAIVARAHDGVIHGNSFRGTGSSCILLSNEIGRFFSGPLPHNITICHNDFADIYGMPIVVDADTQDGRIVDYDYNVEISNNNFRTFQHAPWTFVTINNGKGVRVEGNSFKDRDGVSMTNKEAVDSYEERAREAAARDAAVKESEAKETARKEAEAQAAAKKAEEDKARAEREAAALAASEKAAAEKAAREAAAKEASEKAAADRAAKEASEKSAADSRAVQDAAASKAAADKASKDAAAKAAADKAAKDKAAAAKNAAGSKASTGKKDTIADQTKHNQQI